MLEGAVGTNERHDEPLRSPSGHWYGETLAWCRCATQNRECLPADYPKGKLNSYRAIQLTHKNLNTSFKAVFTCSVANMIFWITLAWMFYLSQSF